LQPLVLSSFAVATALGAGQERVLAALRAGESALKPCRFEDAALATYTGEIEGLEAYALTGDWEPFDCRNNRVAHMALAQDGFVEAVAAARERHGPKRIALVLGTSTSGIHQTELAYHNRCSNSGALPAEFDYERHHNTFALARFLGPYLQLTGPAAVQSAACATTAKAFASARRLIETGICDAAIVGGADSLCLTTLYGFRSLGLTSEGPCRPYDETRDGISIGEGAGFALLEREDGYDGDSALRLLGVGESGDAYHQSSPHPEGLGARLAMERALAIAGLAPSAIDYINLHGTATRIGDAAEDCAITGLLGRDVPCSSTKGQTGHTLGAAGIVEAIITALGLMHGFIPGSPMTETVDPALHCNYMRRPSPRRLTRVMSNSFGFGGSNCSVILGRS
jgi:3-oxoacyl-[acyl-carrier-protein] synthase-1